LNRFLLDFSGLPSFRGLFRFEDLYQSEDPGLNNLAPVMLDHPVIGLSPVAVGKAQRALVEPIQIDNKDLIRAVMDLSVQLGHDEDEVHETMDNMAIAKRYGSLRLVAQGALVRKWHQRRRTRPGALVMSRSSAILHRYSGEVLNWPYLPRASGHKKKCCNGRR
jgi:hypothetical protein